MKAKSKRSRQRNWMTELAQEGVESSDAACQFVGADDSFRDRLALPSADERNEWLAYWSNDTLVFEALVEEALGCKLSSMASRGIEGLLEFFDRARRCFD